MSDEYQEFLAFQQFKLFKEQQKKSTQPMNVTVESAPPRNVTVVPPTTVDLPKKTASRTFATVAAVTVPPREDDVSSVSTSSQTSRDSKSIVLKTADGLEHREKTIKRVHRILASVRPTSSTLAFGLLRKLYLSSPECFTVQSDIHTSANDPAEHITFSVHIVGNYHQNYHIYGFWTTSDNGFPEWKATKITSLENNTPVTVVWF